MRWASSARWATSSPGVAFHSHVAMQVMGPRVPKRQRTRCYTVASVLLFRTRKEAENRSAVMGDESGAGADGERRTVRGRKGVRVVVVRVRARVSVRLRLRVR